ncbi:hypothetical protein GIB67_016195 [Kingdonia uniflora]|uniref:Protein-serine/threonine kinase n=1 Tax=Kingdonia uniflora TaxID=39325 RepID=A0A7J7LSW0_9MAGN|nr:hypothetical protein GIB67_016195 [Kingdonia uniflora]
MLFTVSNIEDATVKKISIKGMYLKSDKEDDNIKSGYKSSWKNKHMGEAKGEGSSSKEFYCNHYKASKHIFDYYWKLNPKLRPKVEKSKKERYALATEVRDRYLDSFRDLQIIPDIKDKSDELSFTQMIKMIKVRHKNVVPMMALGVQQLKKDLNPKPSPTTLDEIHKFLDRFYMSRIRV